MKRYGNPSHIDLLNVDDACTNIVPVVDGTFIFHKPETPALLLRILNDADGNVEAALTVLSKYLETSAEDRVIGADSDDYEVDDDSDVESDSEHMTLKFKKQRDMTRNRGKNGRLTVDSFLTTWSLAEQTRFQTGIIKLGPDFPKLGLLLPSKTSVEIMDYYFRFVETSMELMKCDKKELDFNTPNHSGDMPVNLSRKQKKGDDENDAIDVEIATTTATDSSAAVSEAVSQEGGEEGDAIAKVLEPFKKRESARQGISADKANRFSDIPVTEIKSSKRQSRVNDGISHHTQNRLKCINFLIRAKKELNVVAFTLLLNNFKAYAQLCPESPAQFIVKTRTILGFSTLSTHNTRKNFTGRGEAVIGLDQGGKSKSAMDAVMDTPFFCMMPIESVSATTTRGFLKGAPPKVPSVIDMKKIAEEDDKDENENEPEISRPKRASKLSLKAVENIVETLARIERKIDSKSQAAHDQKRYDQFEASSSSASNEPKSLYTLKGSIYTKSNSKHTLATKYNYLSKGASQAGVKAMSKNDIDKLTNSSFQQSLYADFLEMLPEFVGDQAGFYRIACVQGENCH